MCRYQTAQLLSAGEKLAVSPGLARDRLIPNGQGLYVVKGQGYSPLRDMMAREARLRAASLRRPAGAMSARKVLDNLTEQVSVPLVCNLNHVSLTRYPYDTDSPRRSACRRRDTGQQPDSTSATTHFLATDSHDVNLSSSKRALRLRVGRGRSRRAQRLWHPDRRESMCVCRSRRSRERPCKDAGRLQMYVFAIVCAFSSYLSFSSHAQSTFNFAL